MIRTYLKYGVAIALSLIVYFLIMKLLGWHEYPALSIFNGVIYGAGILKAMQVFKQNSSSFSYADGWQIGFLSGAVATLIFTAFMGFYMLEINADFANAVLSNWGLTYTNGVVVILLSTVLMGMSTAVVLSLTFMQLLKNTLNPKRLNA